MCKELRMCAQLSAKYWQRTSSHKWPWTFYPPPQKKEWDGERESKRRRILRLRRAKVSFLWGHISEGLTAVTN